MATKKDLVEAYSFSRRRLVTAFLSGAPGGREVEPARPGRTVVGGIALAVLLIAAAAIASVLAARTQEDWNKVGLVVSKQTSAQYVILKQADHPTLIPVINVTSAQLILGADVAPTYVDQSVIAGQTPGSPIGIFGAPQLLPQPSQFIESGWTSCTDDHLGMSLNISRHEHSVAQPGRGTLVVTTDAQTGQDSYYLIAKSGTQDGQQRRTYAYPVPHQDRLDQTLLDLRLPDFAQAVHVPEAWVRLFPIGGSLDSDSFPIPDWGQAPPPSIARFLPAGAKIGQYYTQDSESFVVTDKGRVSLDPFSLAVYKQTQWGKGHQKTSPTPVSGSPSQSLPGGTEIYQGAHWPNSTLQTVTGQLCAQLDAHTGDEPKVELRSDPTSSAAVSQNSSTNSPVAFTIDRGQGAYVMSGDWNDTSSGSRVVVDPRGTYYRLAGTDTVEKLGYDKVKPPLVPDPWVKLMTAGVDLSTNAALCPPTQSSASGPSSASGVTCQEPPS